jgi:hypothetical protein
MKVLISKPTSVSSVPSKRRVPLDARHRRLWGIPRAIVALLLALFIAGIVIINLIRYERTMPLLLADDLPKADAVLVEKGERRLSLLQDGRIYQSYRIYLGGKPVGPKERRGDLRTPEGDYVLDWRNPESVCYKSLHISYPNAEDERMAAERGDDPGGAIMVHGLRNGFGWLGGIAPYLYEPKGCIAVRNTHMEEIWRAVDDGTPIQIRP